MRVADLEGPALDLWAGNALDVRVSIVETTIGATYCADLSRRESYGPAKFQPSRDWALAGPIIEQRCISIEARAAHIWIARAHRIETLMRPAQDLEHMGPTPLIAAMRVLVAWRFGDEVPASA
ncbi:phage protein NinX family protein [Massilia oculi]|uniref:DUF2591 domain-containing protein n=1 Tax=Massilia oculi TaxID=945844 RepID=A0A2S2DDD8_9BURK|nr:hypothetical protein DIR46_02280 [Massilia oculi]